MVSCLGLFLVLVVDESYECVLVVECKNLLCKYVL